MARRETAPLKIHELNEVGKTAKTYVCSYAATSQRDARIDIITERADSRITATRSLGPRPTLLWIYQYAVAIFLPSGFPHTVKHDYVSYQIYNILQAFLSSIASLLASRAVLEGIGVGMCSSLCFINPHLYLR